MTRKYPNLYGDSSRFNVPIRGQHVPECVREPLASRILQWQRLSVPVFGHWAWTRGLISWEDFSTVEGCPMWWNATTSLKRAWAFHRKASARIRRLLPRAVQKKTGLLVPGDNRKPGELSIITT